MYPIRVKRLGIFYLPAASFCPHSPAAADVSRYFPAFLTAHSENVGQTGEIGRFSLTAITVHPII